MAQTQVEIEVELSGAGKVEKGLMRSLEKDSKTYRERSEKFAKLFLISVTL
jgi:hypothetical protein